MLLSLRNVKNFLKGCKYNGIKDEVAIKVFADLEKFGGYAFNQCLHSNTVVEHAITKDRQTLGELVNRPDNGKGFILESKIIQDNKTITVNDEVEKVFPTGVKEVFKIEFDNGFTVECTMDHKFLCSDNQFHTVEEILEGDFEILYEDQ